MAVYALYLFNGNGNDSSASPANLSISSATSTTVGNGNGYNLSTSSRITSGTFTTASKLYTSYHGSQTHTATVEVIIDALPAPGNAYKCVAGYSTDANGAFLGMLNVYDDGSVEWNASHATSNFSARSVASVVTTGTRYEISAVVDSTQGTAAARVKLYLSTAGGTPSLLSLASSGTNPLNGTLSLPVSGENRNLNIGQRGDGNSFRSLDCQVSFYRLDSSALDSTAITALHAAISADNDTDPDAGADEVEGTLSETASQNTESIGAGVRVSGSASGTASQNTETISSGVRISAVAAETASQNTEAITAGVRVSGSVTGPSTPNTEAIAAGVRISGSVAEQASPNTEALAVGVIVGSSVSETANQNTEAAAASVLISASIAETASKAVESISSGAAPAFGTIAETPSQNTEAITAGVVVSGSTAETISQSTESIGAGVRISGALTETPNQATDSIAASVAISGALTESPQQATDAISDGAPEGPIMGILANSASVTMTTSTDDDVHPGYVVGEMVTLSVTTPGTEYLWSTSIPSASSAARSTLSSTTGATPRFLPDVGGTYLITCVVDGSTVYVLRIGVQAASVAEPIEALRCSPRKDTTVPAPAMGRSVYFSNGIGQLVSKDPSDRIVPLQLGRVGNHLTDVDATITIGDGNVRTLRTSTLTANRTITLGTSGAEAGDSITLIRYDVTEFTLEVVNGGSGEGTLVTLPASAMWAAEFTFDGTDWSLLRKLKVA